MTYSEAKRNMIGLMGYLEIIGALDSPTYDSINISIEALEEVEKHRETFEWCDDCREYDQEEQCCHRWTKCIKEAISKYSERQVDCNSCKSDECSMCIHWKRLADFYEEE